jgi:hypothetical protein
VLSVLACWCCCFGALAISAADIALRAELAVIACDTSARTQDSTLASLTAHSTNITAVCIKLAAAAGFVSALHWRRNVSALDDSTCQRMVTAMKS